MYKKTIFLLVVISVLLFSFGSVYAETSLMVYDVVYSITETDSGSMMTVTFTVYNGESVEKAPLLVAALYDDGALLEMNRKEPIIASGASVTEVINVTIPSDKTDAYYVKIFAWESSTNIRPLGNAKIVNDIDSYQRDKYFHITASKDSEFKIYINSETAEGNSSSTLHTIKYDPVKLVPVDLCGLTYEKEISSCEISDAGIVIDSFDSANGEIVYKFTTESGRNTGINNIIKFKALADLQSEEIEYTIQ